jgi:RNA polymerase primary sigma factor
MEMLGMTKEEIETYFRMNAYTLSTDMAVGNGNDEEGGIALKDTLYDKETITPEDDMMQKTVENEITAMLNGLNEREAEIISCYFGLNGKTPMTLEEIGEVYGLTRERVRQIKERCIQRLKDKTNPGLLRAYIQ